MTAITTADLMRLALEIADSDKIEFLETRGIEKVALIMIADHVKVALAELAATEDVGFALDGMVGWMFQLGFEACEQFASRAENSQAGPQQ